MTTISEKPDVYISDDGYGVYTLHFRGEVYDGYQLSWCKSFLRIYAREIARVPVWNAQHETWGQEFVLSEAPCTAQ